MAVKLANTKTNVVSGRDAISEAYRQEGRASAYLESRYESDPFGQGTHAHQVRRLRQIFTGLHASRVLEVATGPARLTVHLPRVQVGVGIEQSPAMIRIAEERLRCHRRDDWNLQQGDAFALPFQKGEFDLALSFKLVRHFDRNDRIRLLTNMRHAVRSGGHVVLDVANATAYRWLYAKWGIEKGWIDDYWFTASEFRSEAATAGFVQVRLYPIQPAIIAQYYCWSYLSKISSGAAQVMGRALEYLPFGQPLEWIAVCRCE